MVDVDGVATEEPYQCAGLTEFCQYEDCVAGQKYQDPERPRTTPLDRKDLATLRLFVDPDRRAALAGGKKRLHIVWGIAPENRSECTRCRRAALLDQDAFRKGLAKHTNKCSDPFGKGCTNRSSGGHTACLDCQREKKQRKAALSS